MLPVTPVARELAAPVMPLLGGRIRVDRFVAEGGFGRVYQGHHIALDRPVAVKVLKVPPEYGAEARAVFCERFAQEARIIARLDHPAIVRALDFGVVGLSDGETAPYMVLDWIDGVPLADRMAARRAEGRPFDRAEVLGLLAPVMEAIAVAHAQGIVHRDITPRNLMVVETAAGPSLRLLDFGIAKVMEPDAAEARDDTFTHTAMLAFSPRWAAPEQASRGRTGPWTDVHALGLLCTAMLTGERPYRGPTETLYTEIFSAARPSPATFGLDAGAWEPVLARAVALRPDERQPDVASLLRELAAALRPPAPPVRAALPSTAYALAGALLALLLVALGSLVGDRHRGSSPSAPPPAPTSVVAVLAPVEPAVSPVVAPAPAPALRPASERPPAVRAARLLRREGAVPAGRTDPRPMPGVRDEAPTAPARPRIQPMREYP